MSMCPLGVHHVADVALGHVEKQSQPLPAKNHCFHRRDGKSHGRGRGQAGVVVEQVLEGRGGTMGFRGKRVGAGEEWGWSRQVRDTAAGRLGQCGPGS